MKLSGILHYKFARRAVGAAYFLLAALFVSSFSSPAYAQYKRTDLVSDQTALANPPDPQLVNAWGLTRFPFSPFWVSDNVTGFSTLYDGGGVKQGLVVAIPPASGNKPGQPTGVIANGTGDFSVSENGNSGSAFFIFATLDGTISGWNPGVDLHNAVIGADRSAFGAVYTGLAIGSNSQGNFLFAADNGPNSQIDVFNSKFQYMTSFTDPENRGGLAPYGIRNIGGKLYVTFGGNKAADGFVDVFDTEGNLINHKPLVARGPLHSPWGIALAPPDFGPFSNALLIGNNIPGGRVNAFNPDTGQFLGTLTDASGNPIVIDQLWGLEFGGDNAKNGAHNQLFFTAGPNNYAHGTFGVITFEH